MAMVRILSTGGVILSGISPSDQRERIRVAIMQRGIKDKPFDAHQSFGEAFGTCFPGGARLELRIRPRDELGRPRLGLDPLYGPGEPGDSDEGDEDDE
jgi:hypothetical protein